MELYFNNPNEKLHFCSVFLTDEKVKCVFKIKIHIQVNDQLDPSGILPTESDAKKLLIWAGNDPLCCSLLK